MQTLKRQKTVCNGQPITAPTCNFLRVNAQMQGWTLAKNYK